MRRGASKVLRRYLLINPPGPRGTTVNREGASGMGSVVPTAEGFLYPSATLARMGALLRQAGRPVTVLDAPVERWTAARTVVAAATLDPAWIGVWVSWCVQETDVEFLLRLRRRIDPGTPVVCFGHSLPFVDRDLLALVPGVRLLPGEPDLALARWKDHLDELPEPLSPAQGGDEEVDPDDLPFPEWSLLKMNRFGAFTLLASRGCPYHCLYCPYAIAEGHAVRRRQPQRVADELAWGVEQTGLRSVIFRDIVFGSDPDWTRALCEKIEQCRLGLEWECETRADTLTPLALEAMHRAGCRRIKFGVETSDPDTLLRWRRVDNQEEADAYRDRFGAALSEAKRLGIASTAYVIKDVPGQGAHEHEETLAWVRSLKPDRIVEKSYEWYPGTPFFAGNDC